MKRTIRPKTVITGHANADFDCLAAIVAAGKLYPGATLIFPGSQEKTLKNFFIQSATYLFNFVPARDVDPETVETLVVVDTRQRGRVPHVHAILEKPGVKLHLYDHHPDSDDDMHGELEVVESWGSCAAMIGGRIRDKGIELTPEEATILGLGIYEDTGSFTFNSTTPEDLAVASWLRTQGMELNVIADLITRDLTAEQVQLLNAMLETATAHDVNGISVVLAEASMERYMGDFALLAHKMMDMENLRVLFALGRMQDRIVIVARSRSPEVDVARICESFGGGGHPYAASATVKDLTLSEVKDQIFALLYSSVNPQLKVATFMARPARSMDKLQTLAEAAELMTRYGFKAVPVVDGSTGAVVGILEQQLADKAKSHGLGDVEIREYMQREVKTLAPDSDLYQAMEIIVGQRQRLVPVVEDGHLEGVLTRTDLINIMVEEPARIPESLLPERKRERSVSSPMRERLPSDIHLLLQKAGELAERLGNSVYVVGGFVRDLLLGRPNLDVDLVVEGGDGIVFAQLLAESLRGRVKAHHKFRTAVVILPGGQRVDVATARLEYYEHPAALPTVELSSLKMDLYRRDFTINALAVHLNPGHFGKLVDFFGAQRDIKDRVVRVLHSLSFVEDPTRILRAIRFEQRFGFVIGGQTERLIKNAVQLKFFERLTGGRILHELKLILAEDNVIPCIRRMNDFKLFEQIYPGLTPDEKRMEILDTIKRVLDWHRLLYISPAPRPWLVYLIGLCSAFKDEEVKGLLKRLHLPKREQLDFLDARSMVGDCFGKIINWHNTGAPMSELCELLSPVPLEGVLYLMARSRREEIRRALSQYLTSLRHMTLDVDGKDLQRLGMRTGPGMGIILRKLLAAKIDGHAECRDDQLRLARELIEIIPVFPEQA